jgi:Rho GTPase-activating protein RGD1
LFESVILSDGSTLAPAGDEGNLGLKPTFEGIDNRADFRVYMQNYAYAHGGSVRGPRREGPPEAGFVRHICRLSERVVDLPKIHLSLQLPPLPSHAERMQTPAPMLASPSMSSGGAIVGGPGAPAFDRSRPTFGIDLTEQMTRDNVEVPPIIEKCCEAVERHGLQSQGIYRLSGTQSKVQKLKEKLDRGQCFSQPRALRDMKWVICN